jgi:YVTN family beta-propeller protein
MADPPESDLDVQAGTRAPSGWLRAPDGWLAGVNRAEVDLRSFALTAGPEDVRVAVPVGDLPFFVAVSPDDAFVYVTNYSSQTVSVIDAGTRTVIRNPITFGRPYAVAVTPDGGHVYVTKTSQDKVSVIDTTINAVVATIPVGNTPFGVAVNPAAPRAYVTNAGSNTVSVINTATKSVIAPSLNVGNRPFGVAVNPAGTRVYVTNAELDLQLNDYRVSVIDTATNTVSTIQVGTATPPVGVYPAGVAVAPDGGHVYVTNHGSDDVTVIETATNTVISRIPVGTGPLGVAVAPDGGHVYVTNTNWELTSDNTMSVIETTNHTVETTLFSAGEKPVGVAATARNVYVAHALSNIVSVIDV